MSAVDNDNAQQQQDSEMADILSAEDQTSSLLSQEHMSSHNDTVNATNPQELLPDGPESSAQQGVAEANHETDQQPSNVEEPAPSWPAETRAQTGYLYDPRMRLHNEVTEAGSIDSDSQHPESPRRIEAIHQALVQAKLVRPIITDGMYDKVESAYATRIDARMASKDEILLVHAPEHFEFVESTKSRPQDDYITREQKILQHEDGSTMDSVYFNKHTADVARLCVGGIIDAALQVAQKKLRNALTNTRPPGHHAEHNDCKGFCMYNNVSIAAKVVMRDCPWIKRVAIVDIDVHHGNGIQEAHYDEKDVLYISTHVFKRGTFYPEGAYRPAMVALRRDYGDHLHIGEGDGIGKNINIPWSFHGVGDLNYLDAFSRVIEPTLQEFSPDLVFVACGFDAAMGDPLGACEVTPAGYSQIIHKLKSFADGKLVVCLEGGYNVESISVSAVAVMQTLMGVPPMKVEPNVPLTFATYDVNRVIRAQAKHWNCFKTTAEPLLFVQQSMHDLYRAHKARDYWKAYRMHDLPVKAAQQPEQVLASMLFEQAKKPLLILLHDPLELLGVHASPYGSILSHDSLVRDPIGRYIDEAHKLGFNIIDVNLSAHKRRMPKERIEKHFDWDASYQKYELAVAQFQEAENILAEIFDTYIESGQATHVYLLGTEAGYLAIVDFLKKRTEDAINHIDGMIMFLRDADLTAVYSPTNDLLANWYHRNSQVFLWREHHYWDTDNRKKPRRKFGNIQTPPAPGNTEKWQDKRDEERTLADLLENNRSIVVDWLIERTQGYRDGLQRMENELAQLKESKENASHDQQTTNKRSRTEDESGNGLEDNAKRSKQASS